MSHPQLAAWLIYASLLVGLVRIPLEFSPNVILFLFLIPLMVLLALLAWQISCEKNWARITFAVLFALGLPFAILPLAEALQSRPLSGVLGILQLGLQSGAMILLFLPGGRSRLDR